MSGAQVVAMTVLSAGVVGVCAVVAVDVWAEIREHLRRKREVQS